MKTRRSAGMSWERALYAGGLVALWALMAAAGAALFAALPGSPDPSQLVAPADAPFQTPGGEGLRPTLLTLTVVLLAIVLLALLVSVLPDELPRPFLVVVGILAAGVMVGVLVVYPYRVAQLEARAPTEEELFVDWAAERYGADLSVLEDKDVKELLGGAFGPEGFETVTADTGESFSTFTDSRGTVLVDPGQFQELPRAA